MPFHGNHVMVFWVVTLCILVERQEY